MQIGIVGFSVKLPNRRRAIRIRPEGLNGETPRTAARLGILGYFDTQGDLERLAGEYPVNGTQIIPDWKWVAYAGCNQKGGCVCIDPESGKCTKKMKESLPPTKEKNYFPGCFENGRRK